MPKLIFFLLPLLVCACAKTDTQRPIDPWVVRSVLDQQPRMLTVALDTSMFVAYSAQTGQLYKIWKGGIHLEGAAYNDVKTVQPESWGTTYWQPSPELSHWKVEKEGREIPFLIQFGGYRLKENRITLLYEFRSGTDILAQVEEQPEFEKTADAVALIRTFKLNHAAQGMQLRVYNGNDYIHLPAESAISVTHSFPPLPHQQPKTQAIIGHIGQYWLDRSGCNTCHREEETTIGPGYREIAARYEPDKETITRLVEKVKTGGSGVWGEVTMIPHSHLEEKDIRPMVDYILSLEPRAKPEKNNQRKQPFSRKPQHDPALCSTYRHSPGIYDVTTIHPESFKPR
ncbi:MAG: hypothetical protein R3C61_26790 [Bacteroidia bacterium]